MLAPRCVACVWLAIAAIGFLPDPNAAVALPAPPQFSDLAKSLSDVTGGLVRTVPNVLPKPEDIFSTSKNLLVGYPVEALLKTVNLVCTAAMSSSAVEPKSTPKLDRMNFILMTRAQNYTIPLREAHKLWHHAAFNASRPTEVLVTGWTSNINKSNSALTQVCAAYMCRGGVNFVVSVCVLWRGHFIQFNCSATTLNNNESISRASSVMEQSHKTT